MLARKIIFRFATILAGMILVILSVSAYVQAEDVFRPVVSFHGGIQLTADSYFGYLPDDPVDLDNPEDVDLRKMFTVTSPTTPGFMQTVNLDFYANPVPDLEVNMNLNFRGRWGGYGTSVYLENPLFLREAFARYYTDWAMLTVGRFSYDFDAFNMLLSCQNAARDGVTLHTMFRDTWITVVYNRLLMSMYRDYPYTSTLVLDDLSALRLSRKWGGNLYGLNILFDGFDDEHGASLDFTGTLFGRPLKAELAVVRPQKGLRHKIEEENPAEEEEEPGAGDEEPSEDPMVYLGEGYWPGLLVAVDAYETDRSLLTVRAGAYSKGFYPQYGLRGESAMESAVKLYHNTYGIDLFYQYVLSRDLLLGVNAVCLDYLDKNYQKQLQFRIPTQRLEAKVTKTLSEASTVSLTLGYQRQNQFNYGVINLDWGFQF